MKTTGTNTTHYVTPDGVELYTLAESPWAVKILKEYAYFENPDPRARIYDEMWAASRWAKDGHNVQSNLNYVAGCAEALLLLEAHLA